VKGVPDRAIHIVNWRWRLIQVWPNDLGQGMYMKPKSVVDPETGAMDPTPPRPMLALWPR